MTRTNTKLQPAQRPIAYSLPQNSSGFNDRVDRKFGSDVSTDTPSSLLQTKTSDGNASNPEPPPHTGFSILGKLRASATGNEPQLQTAPDIQAAFEPAYVNDTAQLHKFDGTKDKGTITGSKVKVGDEVQVDTTQSIDNQGNPEWYLAEANGKQGYLRTSKVVLASLVKTEQSQVPDPKFKEPDKLSSAKSKLEGVGKGVKVVSSGFDVVSSGMSLHSPEVQDKKGVANAGEIVGTKKGYGQYAGLVGTGLESITGIVEMIKTAKEIYEAKGAWNKFAAGYDFVTTGASTVSSGAELYNAGVAIKKGEFIQPPKKEDGPIAFGSGEGVANITGSIAAGLKGLKSAAEGIMGVYKLFKSQSDEKGKDALVTLKSFTDAAQNAAKVAKNTYELIGKAVPPALLQIVPVLGIAMSTINILIRLYDALKAGGKKAEMIEESTKYCRELAALVGEPLPDTENVENSKLFVADKRGTFPVYKTYFRTKADLRDKFYTLADRAKSDTGAITNKQDTYLNDKQDKQLIDLDVQNAQEEEQNTQDQNKKETAKLRRSALQVEQRKATQKLALSRQELVTAFGEFKPADRDPIFDILKVDHPLFGALSYIGRMADNDFPALKPPVAVLSQLEAAGHNMRTYEYVDKMSEINQKRQVGSWTDIILELISMSADIVTLATSASGLGPAIAQGLKALTGGYKAVHGVSKFTQKLYRDHKGTERSSENKHKEYVNHAKFIYQQYANLDSDQPDVDEVARLEKYVRATGVNYGLWMATRFNPAEQVKMLVGAMKQR